MINVSISGEKVNAPFWHPQQRKHTRPYWAKWIPSPAGMLIQLFLVPKYAAKYICMQKLLSIPMKEIHVSTRIHDIKCCLKDMILERACLTTTHTYIEIIYFKPLKIEAETLIYWCKPPSTFDLPPTLVHISL